MQLHTQPVRLHPRPVIAIGNFDGVHRGHHALISHARQRANALETALAVLTFEPHPRAVFRPDEPQDRLTPPDVKAWRLEQAGCDYLFSLPFTWEFASLPPQEFIQRILQNELDAAHIVVGFDFCFGKMRKGSAQDIAQLMPTSIISQETDPTGEKFSSSRIRQFLREGQIDTANDLLGWNWEIWGTVTRGDQRGRTLGYPTANIPLNSTLHPAYGIYAAYVCVGEKWYPAAVNIGIRPMFALPVAQVEAHILGFDQDIYDQKMRVQLVKKLRGEAKFDSLESLKHQMAMDCTLAAEILRQTRPNG